MRAVPPHEGAARLELLANSPIAPNVVAGSSDGQWRATTRPSFGVASATSRDRGTASQADSANRGRGDAKPFPESERVLGTGRPGSHQCAV